MGPTSVLPSPVRCSEMRPWWRTMAPISWTSKGRMPSFRRDTSRAAANTSGQDIVEGRLEPLEVVLLTRPTHVGATLPLRVVQLIVGGRCRGGVLGHLGPDLGHLLADLFVRECLVVLLETVDLGHDGAQLGQVGFITAAHEAGQDAAHGIAKYRAGSIGAAAQSVADSNESGAVGQIWASYRIASCGQAAMRSYTPVVIRAVRRPYARAEPADQKPNRRPRRGREREP